MSNREGTVIRKVVERDFQCEIRAVEEGHKAFVQPGGWIRVVSDSRPGVFYTLTFHQTVTGAIHFHCDCPSGTHRGHLLIPCKHAALAGRRLEREKIAVWNDALWWVHPDLLAKAPVDRPVAKPNISALVD